MVVDGVFQVQPIDIGLYLHLVFHDSKEGLLFCQPFVNVKLHLLVDFGAKLFVIFALKNLRQVQLVDVDLLLLHRL